MIAHPSTVPVAPRPCGPFKTHRQDAWWGENVFSLVTFALFTVYTIWAVLQNTHYEWGPYLSPFYSPHLTAMFPETFNWVKFSPAFLVIWMPLGFRATCYFCRRVYHRAVFNDPASCAVELPKPINYTGEKAFPFVLLNMHRYFLYLALVLVVFHWSHVWQATQFEDGFHVGLGTLVITLDALFLTLYVFSCHSLRHLIGGRLNHFSKSGCSQAKHTLWSVVSKLNEHHGKYFWISLFAVWAADAYVRLVAMGCL
ncbi:MAG: succinate dehydrogenase, partial [Cyanobacteria bacterium HKST-UBA05]|nr:succinate dehydrogenase [Cyanobacteria bacterium HKST-UBA05]